jgi:hypothetical protein
VAEAIDSCAALGPFSAVLQLAPTPYGAETLELAIERPFVELVGLRSESARAEIRGNRAVGELIRTRPGDEWISVRLTISGKRVKVFACFMM